MKKNRDALLGRLYFYYKAVISSRKLFLQSGNGRQILRVFIIPTALAKPKPTGLHFNFFQAILHLKAMKRICFLLTFFLTGFSLVTNKESLRNTYLLACNEEVYEIHLESKADSQELSEETSEAGFVHNSFAHTGNLICSISK